MKIPEQDYIKFIRYHRGWVQDAGNGNWFESECGGRLLPIEQYEYENAVWGKFKCQKCGVWVNLKLQDFK